MTTQMVERPKSPRVLTPFSFFLILIILALAYSKFGGLLHTTRVAIITSGDSPYWDQVEAGVKKGGDLYGVNVSVIRCKPDLAIQNDAIRQAMDQKYDGIAISPVDPNGEAAALANIASNTNLVTLDSDSPVARRLCFIGSDNYDAGRLCGQIIHSALPDGGSIIMCLSNAEKQNTQRRRQGVIDELLQRSFDPDRSTDPFDAPITGDNYTILATLVDGGNAATATKLAADAIKQYPDVKCLVGLQFSTAGSMVDAIAQAGRAGKIQVVGFDTKDVTLAGIDSGKIAGTVMQDQFDIGVETVHILSDCARGDMIELPVFAKRLLPCKIITKANLGEALQSSAAAPTTQPN